MFWKKKEVDLREELDLKGPTYWDYGYEIRINIDTPKGERNLSIVKADNEFLEGVYKGKYVLLPRQYITPSELRKHIVRGGYAFLDNSDLAGILEERYKFKKADVVEDGIPSEEMIQQQIAYFKSILQ